MSFSHFLHIFVFNKIWAPLPPPSNLGSQGALLGRILFLFLYFIDIADHPDLPYHDHSTRVHHHWTEFDLRFPKMQGLEWCYFQYTQPKNGEESEKVHEKIVTPSKPFVQAGLLFYLFHMGKIIRVRHPFQICGAIFGTDSLISQK